MTVPGFTSRVALLLLGSGFASLVYQIAWLRLLRLVFGASTASSAAVLAIFMGGLGLGSLLLGPWADRSPSPLRLYARLEVGIALAAAATPLLVEGVRWLYTVLGGTGALGFTGGTVVRLVLSAAVLGLPAFLMGGTLPATVRAVTGATDQGRRGLGLLYAANTLGAVAGTLVTTFVAIEHLGTRRTLWVAALLNLLVAVAARALARSREEAEEAAGETPPAEAAEAEPGPGGTVPVAPERRAPVGLVLAAAGLTGFAFFLMELVWYRMLAPVLGGTSYTFGLILAVALFGIGAGGWVYGAGSRGARPTLLGFGVTCALEAVALGLPLALGDRIAFLAHELQGMAAAGFGALVGAWTVVTVLVVLPAALVAGYQFPLLVGLLGEGRRRVGREVGLAYAWNTAGAIAGSIAGGFGLLPLLSAPGAWRLAVVLLAALGVVAAVVAGTWGRARSAAAAGATLVALLAAAFAAAPGPSAFWRHAGIGANRLNATLQDPNDLRAEIRRQNAGVVWEADGRESGVALVRSAGYAFIVNGKSDGAALGDAGTQVMGGLVGSMLHPRPERALVIGLGTGSTAGWLADVPGMERVDVVELEPAILRVARACTPVNRGVLDHPKVEVVVGDGRELLLTTDRRYDVVFSEPSNPYRAGISSLYTREFYQAASERLRDGGLFVQWLQGYEVDASVVRTAYATLASVFPAVESWQTLAGDLMLVASEEPVVHDLERVRRRAAGEPYAEALSRVWGVSGAEGFYSGFVAGPGFARAVAEAEAEAGRVNTDDHPVIEFGFVRNLGRRGLFSIEELVRLARRRGEHRPAFRGPEPDWFLVDDARLARGAFFDQVPQPPPAPGPGSRLDQRYALRRDFVDDDWEGLRLGWEGEDPAPRHRVDLLAWGEALAEASDDRAAGVAERLREVSPGEAEVVLALLAARQDRNKSAAWHLENLFRGLRSDPWVRPGALGSSLRLAVALAREDRETAETLFDLLAEPFAVGASDDQRRLARLQIAASVPREGVCLEAMADLEPWVPWDEGMLSGRLRCYEEHDHPLQWLARQELAEFRSHEPPDLDRGLEPPADPGG